MSGTEELATVDEIRAVLVDRLGLSLDHSGMEELADILKARFRETDSRDAGSYLRRLTSASTSRDELRALAGRLTVQETYFFRNPDHFRALAEVALPDRLQAAKGAKVRLLSAGTATGEEAFTMAIHAREMLGDAAARSVSILGLDIDPEALRFARLGRYGPWALRSTPPDILRSCFRPAERHHELIPEVRALARFEERNLVEHDPAFWQPGAFDVIFCRNVIIYFSPEAIRDVIARLTRSLAPGGYLFLGHSENLRGLSSDYHLMHTHDTFYYRRRGEAAPASGMPDRAHQKFPPGTSWFEAINRATEKIAKLTTRPALPASQPAPHAAASPPAGLARANELFQQERFDDAMTLLRGLSAGEGADPDALILTAAVLINRNEIQEAEQLCRRVLLSDEMNAGAHYLIALGRELAGDAAAAAHHAMTAVYLDPTFAMPHLHLGRLARRAGEMDTARRELEQTIHLLAREDASRILLFGGGFQRAALLELCVSELRSCGGRP